MKKLIKVFLIVLIVLSVAVGAVALWQRKNIEGILIGIRETSEEIEKRRDENQSNLVKEIDSYIETTLRELTPEEQKQIEEGTIQVSEVYSKIFEEKSSQKHLGNIYEFFEKRNSFASVTTWQSSNIGCFFVAQF